jgi:hypothetical protein
MQFLALPKRPLARTRDRRLGQAVLLFAILFLVLAGVLGLVFDGARLYYEKQRVQAAADAGAVGAVQELRRANNDYNDDVRPAAENDIALHGFTDANATIEVNLPPLSGEHVGDSNYVEVYVAEQVPTSFMRIFGVEASTVRARAVSGLKATGDPCIIALDPDNSDAFKHNGNPTLFSDCGIMVNSSSNTAMRQVGSGCITASWVGVTGGASGSCINPTPSTGIDAVIDPLLTLPVPDYSSMGSGYTTSAAGTSAFGGSSSFAANGNGNGNGGGNGGGGNGGGNGGGGSGGGVVHYWPGYYSNEIKIQNGTAVFEPGVYVLEKGLKITGGTVTGSEVFFYNVNSDGKQFIDVGGNATFQLSAPLSGPYKGMLFFNNRNAPDRSPGNKIARGNEDSYLIGALYFPSQHLDWAGNPENHIFWTMIIANTINISGTADIMVINKPTMQQAPPAYRAVLWE